MMSLIYPFPPICPPAIACSWKFGPGKTGKREIGTRHELVDWHSHLDVGDWIDNNERVATQMKCFYRSWCYRRGVDNALQKNKSGRCGATRRRRENMPAWRYESSDAMVRHITWV